MLKNFTKPFLGLVILSAFVLAIAASLFKTVLEPYYLDIFPYLLLFFFLVNVGALYFKIKAFFGRDLSFPRHLMVINGARIFVYVIFLASYLFFNIENSTYFLLGFLACYFVYFIFDLAVSNKYK